MKAASGALATLLNTAREFRVADLLTIALVGGTTLRYSSADIDIVAGGNTFLTAHDGVAPIWQRSGISLKIGLEIDELELKFHPNATHLINGQAWFPAARDGVFDGAQVTLERAFMPTWGNTADGTLIMFSGLVGNTEGDGTMLEMKVVSDLFLLNVPIPRNLYQPGCLHTLYDSGCALTKTAFEQANAATSGSTRTQVNNTLLQADGFFNLGTISFTSGPNNGVSRTVKSYTTGVLQLMNPLPSVPGVGDTFKAYPGCDKLQKTCGANSSIVYTVDSGTDTFTSTAHGLLDDNAVKLSTTGTFPGATPALDGVTIYFVVNAAANTFKLARTIRGTPIDITSNGTGTNSVSIKGKFANLINFRGMPYIPVPETLL